MLINESLECLCDLPITTECLWIYFQNNPNTQLSVIITASARRLQLFIFILLKLEIFRLDEIQESNEDFQTIQFSFDLLFTELSPRIATDHWKEEESCDLAAVASIMTTKKEVFILSSLLGSRPPCGETMVTSIYSLSNIVCQNIIIHF